MLPTAKCASRPQYTTHAQGHNSVTVNVGVIEPNLELSKLTILPFPHIRPIMQSNEEYVPQPGNRCPTRT